MRLPRGPNFRIVNGRPTLYAPDLDHLPTALTSVRCWVVVKDCPPRRRPDVSEPPIERLMSPFFRGKVSVTSPSSWLPFEAARQAYLHLGYDAIAFVLGPIQQAASFTPCPFVGIDLLGCRDSGSGEIATWAREIIGQIGSYAEVGPFDTDIRIFAKGAFPPGRRRVKQIELFDDPCYLVVSGRRVDGAPTEVVEATDRLGRLQRAVERVRRVTAL